MGGGRWIALEGGEGTGKSTQARRLADRAEHLAVVVAPALDAGRTVVSDRSAWSSLAYQGYGRGLDLAELHRLSGWAMRGRWPDLVVLVDVTSDEAAARLAAAGRSADRLEAEAGGFHRRVRDGFRALAAGSPDRWVVVDGAGSEDAVADRIQAAVRARLGDIGARHHA
jgi:dTMP kinase